MELSSITKDLLGQKMFQIMEEAKNIELAGSNVLHFEIGDPDFDSPDIAKQAIKKYIDQDITHYAPSSGLLELKEASRKVTFKSRGFEPDLDQLLVTSGANIQIYLACACLINPGDEIIIPDPGFVSYVSIIKSLRGIPKFVPLSESNNFTLDPKDLNHQINSKTKAIIVNSPHNPTGAVISREGFIEIFEICRQHNLYLISDEVYGRMIYNDFPNSFFSPSQIDKCKERTLMIHSFSKTFSMTGWRIGAVTGPEKIIKKMSLLFETINSCVPPFIQLAAADLLNKDPQASKSMVEEYQIRRNLFMNGIENLRLLSCIKPMGAFYAFVNIKKTELSSEEFCKYLLNESRIAACPGNFFGITGEGFVRFCFANSQENISLALKRIKDLGF
ncbi:pyridoxal phosphate-dependent aminotransferase [Prochlorococcus sp. MIT 1300]|uniref:pyridoxal phosphate-dependent aminotransferase n=1 Tax=Prochlorococcus sp. MIT 1300 TaxID=3096218 RepID=UPI002A758679|nr:aminotransferase class I/II-fold pyridoxal phosphate-dependent enzyme [Prochlorococcus sp. MIT 1300]